MSKYVLIACEESQTECLAFRALGAIAFSCDIQKCSGGHPEWHIHSDVLPLLKKLPPLLPDCCNPNSISWTASKSFTKVRSKSFFEIANAMASQWLPLI